MLAIRFRWKGKCPRHPNYNPGKGGEQAIKGACPYCRMLFAVYADHRKTLAMARVFDEVGRVGDVMSAIRSAGVRAFSRPNQNPPGPSEGFDG